MEEKLTPVVCTDDAVFVASFNIPGPPDDEKVYFFFEETAKEFDFFEKLTVSRVARVCKVSGFRHPSRLGQARPPCRGG